MKEKMERLEKKIKMPWESWGLELYDKIWISTEFNREQLNLISEALISCHRVLDLGVGLGNVAKRLTEMGKTVCGVDIDQKSLDFAKAKINSPNFFPVLEDAQMLGFEEEFDGASCATTMQYFKDLDSVMGSVYKALKPKGLFAITGFEADKMEKWGKLVGEQLKQAIVRGELILTEEEISKVTTPVELTTIDSSFRTREALLKNNFDIMKGGNFYHGTSYFIIGRRD